MCRTKSLTRGAPNTALVVRVVRSHGSQLYFTNFHNIHYL